MSPAEELAQLRSAVASLGGRVALLTGATRNLRRERDALAQQLGAARTPIDNAALDQLIAAVNEYIGSETADVLAARRLDVARVACRVAGHAEAAMYACAEMAGARPADDVEDMG